MDNAQVSDTRNFALIGHAGDGKTSLGEALLHRAGATTHLGRVDDGTSFLNYLPEEKNGHTATISNHLFAFDWQATRLNLVDTPGDPNFQGDGRIAVQALDGAVLVLSAVDGVKVGTQKMRDAARASGIALVAFVTGLDRERSDLARAVESLAELDEKPIVLTIPVGDYTSLSGVVDLVTMKMVDAKGNQQAIPTELSEEAEARRLELVEAVAECDDVLLEKYLEEGEIGEEEVLQGLIQGTRSGQILPVLCGSAIGEVGTDPLLRGLIDLLPSPGDRAPWKGKEGEEGIAPDPDGPFSAVVFKTLIDRYRNL